MVDYVLKRDENGMVHYLYKNDGKHPYVGYCKLESAEWMLRQGEVVVSEEYEGFPVTANGMYFFEAEVNGGVDSAEERREAEGGRGERTLSVTADAVTPSPAGEGFGVTCGPDYCEIPELAEKPRRKKRVKDVVCE